MRRREPMPLELALCGAGDLGLLHAAVARRLGIAVTAVASRDPRRAVAATETTGGQAVLYDELPAGADLTVVTTPPVCHADHVVALLKAGSAVLVEPPLCTTLRDADRIVTAAEHNPGRLLYAENLAFAPVVHELLDRAPALGPLEHLEVRSLQPPAARRPSTSQDSGDDVLATVGSHAVALALLTAQAARAGAPVGVSAVVSPSGDEPGSAAGGDATATTAEILIRFTGGLRARVVAGRRASGAAELDVQVASATGVLRAELQPHRLLEHDGEPVRVAGNDDPLVWSGYTGQLSEFVDDIRSGSPPALDAAFGRAVLDVVCAAAASAGDGAGEGAFVPLPFAGRRDRTPQQLWRDDPG